MTLPQPSLATKPFLLLCVAASAEASGTEAAPLIERGALLANAWKLLPRPQPAA